MLTLTNQLLDLTDMTWYILRLVSFTTAISELLADTSVKCLASTVDGGMPAGMSSTLSYHLLSSSLYVCTGMSSTLSYHLLSSSLYVCTGMSSTLSYHLLSSAVPALCGAS